MIPNRLLGALIATWTLLTDPPRRDERGGSEIIGVLLLIAGVIAIAAIAVIGIRSYVQANLP